MPDCYQRPRPSTSNPEVCASLIPFLSSHPTSFSDPEFIPLTAGVADADAGQTARNSPRSLERKGNEGWGRPSVRVRPRLSLPRNGYSCTRGRVGEGRESSSQRGPRPLRRKPALPMPSPPLPLRPTSQRPSAVSALSLAGDGGTLEVSGRSEGRK